MPKSLTSLATGCMAAVAAITFATAQPQAQEFQGPDHFGPGGHGGPGMMMAQAMGPQGQMSPQGQMGQQGRMGRMGPGGDSAKGAGRGNHSAFRERRRAQRMARRMEVLDTNNDGKITLAEIEGELKRLTAAADVNGDGKLSAEEFKRRGRWFLRLRTVSFFDILDSNGDGQVSTKELTAPSGRWFKRQDENKDKALTGDEVVNKFRMRHGPRRWRGRRR
jgi:Ca2+-binding EF-hand superfamily protein